MKATELLMVVSLIVQNSFDVLGRLRVQLGSNLSQDRFVYLNLSRQITELLGHLFAFPIPIGAADPRLLATLASRAVTATFGLLITTVLTSPADSTTAGPGACAHSPGDGHLGVPRAISRSAPGGASRGVLSMTDGDGLIRHRRNKRSWLRVLRHRPAMILGFTVR